MKKHIQLLLVASIVFFATNLFAQKNKVAKPKTPKLTIEQKATRNADTLKARLGLSDIQYAKVIPINVDFFVKNGYYFTQRADNYNFSKAFQAERL